MKNILLLILVCSACTLGSCGGNHSTTPSTEDSENSETLSTSVEEETTETEQRENPAPAVTAEYLFDHSVLLTEEQLARLPTKVLPIMRNEIYARHGYRFKNPYWEKYFARAGFEPRSDHVDDRLSETDRANAQLILAVEATRTDTAFTDLEDMVEPLRISDLDIRGNISTKFRLFLTDWLRAAFMEDSDYIASTIYREDDNISAKMILWEYAQKKNSSEYTTIEYVLMPIQDARSRRCSPDLELADDAEHYLLYTYYTFMEEEDFSTTESMVGYFFAEVEEGYQVYCMDAAG
ncbi:MAG: YARHG domain-containing protein [Bacteroidota bacterium]